MHDATVLRNSNLGQSLNDKISEHFHLLGDSVYPISTRLMKPFRDNGHLTQLQVQFNTNLSKTRSTVERSFGLLKGRFRQLKNLDVTSTDFSATIVTAACVLHNITCRRGDELEEEVEIENDDEDYDDEDEISDRAAYNAAIEKRYTIMLSMCQ